MYLEISVLIGAKDSREAVRKAAEQLSNMNCSELENFIESIQDGD